MIINAWGLKNSNKSAGGLTNRNFKGETIAQQKRAKGQSNPSPQYLQSQAAAALIDKLYQTLKQPLAGAFTNGRKKASNYNKFYTENYHNALDISSPPTASLLYNKIITAKGLITPTSVIEVDARVDDQNVTIIWDTTIVDRTQNDLDTVQYIIYNQTQDIWMFNTSSSIQRSSFEVGINIALTTGDIILTWLAFIAKGTTFNRGMSSNSILTQAIAA